MYKGASIMILLEHDNKLCVILFGDPDYQIHMDLGGHADIGEHPCQTASREAKEESLNTFDLDPNKIILNDEDFLNYTNYNHYYAFFLKFNLSFNLISSIYQNNKNIIFKANTPQHWKETGFITLFTIDSLLNAKIQKTKYFESIDIFGNKKIVHRRPIEYLKCAIKNKIIDKINDIWKTKLNNTKVEIVDNIYNDKKIFLDGTQSIIL